MNNENNELNNMGQSPVVPGGQPVNPGVVPGTVPPVGTTPGFEVPASPAMPQAPVTMPEQMPQAPVMPPVQEAAPVAAPVPAMQPAPVVPETPANPVMDQPSPVAPEVQAPMPEVTSAMPGPAMQPAPVVPETPANPVMNQPGPVAPEVQAPMPVTSNVTSGPNNDVTNTVNSNVSTEPGVQPSEPQKKNNMPIIIAIVAVLVIGLGVGAYFLFSGKDEEKENDNNNKQTQPATPSAAEVEIKTKFLALANKYVAAVDKMWKEDNMLCQDGKDDTALKKPSELSSTNKYEGPANYFVFINTADSSEIKLEVDDTTQVAGWVRIDKASGNYYVALSDGTNYIVDKGDSVNKPTSAELKIEDVITTGNGSNYQYMSGEIFGSATEGNGWGIGDYKVMTDGDDTNNGIYMSNGPKTGGYTPFCSNLTE